MKEEIDVDLNYCTFFLNFWYLCIEELKKYKTFVNNLKQKNFCKIEQFCFVRVPKNLSKVSLKQTSVMHTQWDKNLLHLLDRWKQIIISFFLW